MSIYRVYPNFQQNSNLTRKRWPRWCIFSVDGMSTGVVYMQAQGLALDIPPCPQSYTDITFAKMRIYRGFGAMAAVPRDGICGAALVEDDSEEGGVAGFFQNGNSFYALSPCLDEFIDRSWGVICVAFEVIE